MHVFMIFFCSHCWSATAGGISQYHDNSGAGLRQKVVESIYVQALGVLVVSAARRRSWKPSSPNGAPPTTSPPHPTSVARFEELAGKNCPAGTKFSERGKLDFKSSRRKRRQEGLGPPLRTHPVYGGKTFSGKKSCKKKYVRGKKRP